MKRPGYLVLFAGLCLSVLSAPLAADVVHFKNGGRVEGKVVDLGDSYEITHRFGKLTVNKSRVARIEKKPTLTERFEVQKAKADLKNPDDRVRLGLWCRENGWSSRAVKEFHAALALDSEHRGAHSALGHIFYEGAWRTEREVMELRGFVEYDGEWVTSEEAESLKADEERREKFRAERRRQREIRKNLRRWFRNIAYGTKKQCEKAHGEVVTFARGIKNEKLEKYAGDVKAYFDSYWKAVRQSQYGTLEIRATMSKLKRPIPTFQTSLGASTTPVTLQLPELAIARVQTTVVVPLGRGE